MSCEFGTTAGAGEHREYEGIREPAKWRPTEGLCGGTVRDDYAPSTPVPRVAVGIWASHFSQTVTSVLLAMDEEAASSRGSGGMLAMVVDERSLHELHLRTRLPSPESFCSRTSCESYG
jgi:hypothetical protein